MAAVRSRYLQTRAGPVHEQARRRGEVSRRAREGTLAKGNSLPVLLFQRPSVRVTAGILVDDCDIGRRCARPHRGFVKQIRCLRVKPRQQSRRTSLQHLGKRGREGV